MQVEKEQSIKKLTFWVVSISVGKRNKVSQENRAKPNFLLLPKTS